MAAINQTVAAAVRTPNGRPAGPARDEIEVLAARAFTTKRHDGRCRVRPTRSLDDRVLVTSVSFRPAFFPRAGPVCVSRPSVFVETGNLNLTDCVCAMWSVQDDRLVH